MTGRRRLRHAILGCGRVAISHAAACRLLPDVELAVACDVDEAAARRLAVEFGATAVATDAATVLADPSIDSVAVTLPHHLHAPFVERAIDGGKHVLVEKPPVIDPADGRRILERLAGTDLVVLPVLQHRFDPLVRASRHLVEGGALGRLVAARVHLECVRPAGYYADSPWRGRWRTEGGSVLMNQAFHLVDLLGWLAGDAIGVSAAFGQATGDGGHETESTVCATLRLPGGAVGALTVTGAAGAEWNSFLELLGTGGALAFDIGFPNRLLRLDLADGDAAATWAERLAAATRAQAEEAPPEGIGYYGTSHRRQVEAFFEAVGGSTDHGGATFAESLRTLETVDAIYRAAREGRALDIERT